MRDKDTLLGGDPGKTLAGLSSNPSDLHYANQSGCVEVTSFDGVWRHIAS